MDSSVVVDLGSQTFKAGIAGDFPSSQEPTVILPSAVMPSSPSLGDILTPTPPLRRPYVAGQLEDADALECLLRDILTNRVPAPAHVAAHERALVLADPIRSSRRDRETLAQVAFEGLGVSQLWVLPQPVASLYSIGRLTGIVVDFGHEKTDVSPVVEGVVAATGGGRIPGGLCRAIGELRERIVRRRGEGGAGPAADVAPTTADLSRLPRGGWERLARESLRLSPASVPEGADAESEAGGDRAGPSGGPSSSFHTLPDGQTIRVEDDDAIASATGLADGWGGDWGPGTAGWWASGPGGGGGDSPPTGNGAAPASLSPAEAAVGFALAVADTHARKALLEGLFVCGGGSAVPGLAARVLAQAQMLSAANLPAAAAPVPGHMGPRTPQVAAWAGAACAAKVVNAQRQWVTRGDYNEAGPEAIHRKCV